MVIYQKLMATLLDENTVFYYVITRRMSTNSRLGYPYLYPPRVLPGTSLPSLDVTTTTTTPQRQRRRDTTIVLVPQPPPGPLPPLDVTTTMST